MFDQPRDIHLTLKLLRIFSHFKQGEMAKICGITQSWLSKLEDGNGAVYLDLLIRIQKFYSLSLDSIVDGAIPLYEISKKLGVENKILPKKYCDTSNGRIRALYGFVSLMDKELGRNETKKLINTLGIPFEIFYEPRLPMNFKLFMDVLTICEKNGLLRNDRAIKYVIERNLSFAKGTKFSEKTKTKSSHAEIYDQFVAFSNLYGGTCKYALLKYGEKFIDIEVRPDIHYLKSYENKFSDLNGLWNKFNSELILNIAGNVLDKKVDVCLLKKLSSKTPEGPVYHASW